MCGIGAIIGPDRAVLSRALAAMNTCMSHRGPDDQGVEVFPLGPPGTTAGAGGVGLAQRRLSILDLSPFGHQPMVHPQTGDALIFNGEIYNHQDLRDELESLGHVFRGHSDTEVLLHGLSRWGEAFIPRLAGMYAIVFFERRTSRLLLARDPVGIKPLYVARRLGYTVMASEVRAILATGLVEPRPDKRALATLMAYGAVQEPMTFFEGISSFPPGCLQWCAIREDFSCDGPVKRHWRYPAVDASITEAIAKERLEFELSRAVREHMIADVPVGVFLSSGLDSTIMAALAKQATQSARTFTLGFQDQPDLSEADLARTTARELGVEHHDIQVTGDKALDLAVRWLETLDQPSMDGLNTYVISKAVRDAGVIVALSGLGGDELFGGYPSFAQVPRLLRLNQRMAFLPTKARHAIFWCAGLTQGETVRAKTGEMGLLGPDVVRLALHRRRNNANSRLRTLGFDHRDMGLDITYQDPTVLDDVAGAEDDVIATISRVESRFYMGNMLLRDSDATSMQHSLELRVPLLDRRVMDLAFAIPGHVRMPRPVADKHLLRTTFARFLRPELTQQSKRGFTLPIRRWMTGSLRPLCEESIRYLASTGLVEPAHVKGTWNRFLQDPEDRLWSRAFLKVVMGSYLTTISRMNPPRAPRPIQVGVGVP